MPLHPVGQPYRRSSRGEPVLDVDFFRRWLTNAAAAVDREAARLTELDSPIGDADH
ncbi:dihydroxyacetone kinase subunit L, partial [Streptomyces sp. NPDC005904]